MVHFENTYNETETTKLWRFTYIWSDVVCDNELANSGTRFSSRKFNKLLASSATRGWNNNDLLLSVCGSGEGKGISGNTTIENI